MEQVVTPLPTHSGQQSNRASMTAAQATGQHRNFNARFKTYLTRNLAYLYRLVTTVEGPLSEDLRHQVTHTLTYGLAVDANWPVARDLLLATASDMELAGYREDWLPFLQQGVTQGLHLHDLAAVAECRLQIGMIYRMVSEFDLAHQELQKSIAGFATVEAAHDQARALNELAWLEQLQQQLEAATSHVDQALALLSEEEPEWAVCLRVKGMIAIGHHQWEEAERLHREALRRFEANGDERRRAWSIQNLGYAIHGQKRYEEAIELYQQAAVLLEKLNDVYHWSFVQNNLGVVFRDTDKPEFSVECFQKAIEVAESINDRLHSARLYTNLGLSHLAMHNYHEGKRCFQQSAHLYKALGVMGFFVNAQDGLAMAHIALQEYTEAVLVLEDALAVLPQIQSSPLYDHLKDSLRQHLEQALTQRNQSSNTASSALF